MGQKFIVLLKGGLKMRNWKLDLYNSPFLGIKATLKTVEGRAWTKKIDYRQMRKGDKLTFRNLDTGEELTVMIDEVNWYPSVKEMLENEGLESLLPGVKSIEEGIELYHSFPGYEERIKEGGIFAIRFHFIE